MSIIKKQGEDMGEEYLLRLMQESNRNFQIFLALLSSYWQSRVDGPTYTRMLKAMSVEMARIRLSLESIRTDSSFKSTRSEFLYQTLTSILFSGSSGHPDLNKSDLEFREFLVEILKVYFKGSTPSSLEKVVELVLGSKVKIRQNFKLENKKGSGFDISDQFGFGFDVIMETPSSVDTSSVDTNLKTLFSIISPAHTLYRIKYIIQEEFQDQDESEESVSSYKFLESLKTAIESYDYEDFRKFTDGIYGVDNLGSKKPRSEIGEVMDPRPSLDSYGPDPISVAGEVVTITGDYFTEDIKVIFEGQVLDVVYLNSQTIEVEFPSHSAGSTFFWVKQKSGVSGNMSITYS